MFQLCSITYICDETYPIIHTCRLLNLAILKSNKSYITQVLDYIINISTPVSQIKLTSILDWKKKKKKENYIQEFNAIKMSSSSRSNLKEYIVAHNTAAKFFLWSNFPDAAVYIYTVYRARERAPKMFPSESGLLQRVHRGAVYLYMCTVCSCTEYWRRKCSRSRARAAEREMLS